MPNVGVIVVSSDQPSEKFWTINNHLFGETFYPTVPILIQKIAERMDEHVFVFGFYVGKYKKMELCR